MKKKLLAWIVILLFVINVWSGMVYYAATGGQNLGKLTAPIIRFSEFPKKIFKSLKDLDYLSMSQTNIPSDPRFLETNKLTYDIFALNAYWNAPTNRWSFDLINLRNDSIVYQWNLAEEVVQKREYDRYFRDFRPLNTLITEDKSLIVNFAHLNNLFKIDSNANIVWENHDLGYHHSMEFDADGNIWVCAEEPGEYTLKDKSKLYTTKVRNLNREDMTYKDEFIVKLNAKTGEVLFKKSVSEILVENNYSGLLFNSIDSRRDPIHLNDIQPALDSSAYWKKGDVFLSMRNLSTLALYRPSEDTIIWLRQGPFLNQHDVDIISENEISVFNNNINWAWGSNFLEKSSADASHVLRTNEVVTYNFTTETFEKPYLEYFVSEKLNTRSEGLSQHLSNGDMFVEEQNNGKLYIFSKDEIKLKKVFKTSIEGKIHMTNWMRVYEKSPLQPEYEQ